MSKAKLTAAEWELVKDAPYWVEQALAAAEKQATPAVAKKEEQAVEAVRQGYKTTNALVRDIMADQSERAAAIAKASKADADVALGRIAAIVESKLGGDDLDALNDFLLEVGERVAGAAKENVLGLGEEVSKKEAATLKELAVVLRATDAQKKARKEQAQATQVQATQAAQATHAREEAAAKARQEAQARHEAEAKAKQEAEAKTRQEADAKAKQEAQARLEKAREEAEERQQKLEAERRLEKAREEAEARQKEAQAKREAAKAEEERAAAEAAAAKEAAAKEAAAAPRFTEFIAEHTVVAGENLSFISQKYYGHQGNFRLIYEANKDVIGDNMSLIRPGQKLRIPKL